MLPALPMFRKNRPESIMLFTRFRSRTHRALRSWWISLYGAVLITGCQAVPLDQYYDAHAPVRIDGMKLTAEGSLKIDIAATESVIAQLLRAEGADSRSEWVATLKVSAEAPASWIDSDATATPGTRYYSVAIGTGNGTWTNREEWAVFVRARKAGERYLVSVPVELGAGNRLQGPLGEQLASGLHAGTSSEDADRVEILDAEGRWQHFHLVRHGEQAVWWDFASDAPAGATIAPGVAFWIERGNGVPQRSKHAILFGKTLTGTDEIRFKVDTIEGTPFGIPVSRPLHHHNTEAQSQYSTAPNQLGFAELGSGGKTSDHRRKDEVGDQIWVWHDNEWQGYYWLMDHVGPKWDGRWWDNRTRDFADFALDPGEGYY
jgi:hypothetical protein